MDQDDTDAAARPTRTPTPVPLAAPAPTTVSVPIDFPADLSSCVWTLVCACRTRHLTCLAACGHSCVHGHRPLHLRTNTVGGHFIVGRGLRRRKTGRKGFFLYRYTSIIRTRYPNFPPLPHVTWVPSPILDTTAKLISTQRKRAAL